MNGALPSPTDEAERQRALVAALFAPRADAATLATHQTGARALRGLQAYRLNGDAAAQRALATAFPTLRMLLGEEDFDQLAREFWRADPPSRGDLAEWGAGLADWIGAHPQLAAWPYLADCTRLDWALHCCERAADAAPDSVSFARLADTDPSRLMGGFMPGLALIGSRWPIVSIHAAHHGGDAAAFETLHDAIAQPRAENALVSRHGWKAVVAPVDDDTAQWTRLLLDGHDLASALALAGERFDFSSWLAAALQGQWLKEVRVLPD